MSKTSQNDKTITTKITAEQTIIIIRLIKKYKCIWDKNHPEFQKRQARYNAFKKIGSYFQLTAEDVSRKYRRFRDCYIQDLKHIHEKKKTHRTVFYFDEMEFLRDRVKHRSLGKHTSSSRSDSDGVHSGDKSENDEELLPIESLEDEYSMEEPIEESQFSGYASNHSEEAEAVPAVEAIEIKEEEAANVETANAEEYPIEEIAIEETLKADGDEFDVFAGYLATQLRVMDKLSALETMEELQRVIFKRRIQILKRDQSTH